VCKITAKTPPFLAQLFRAFAALRITQDIQKVSSQQPGRFSLLYRLLLGLFGALMHLQLGLGFGFGEYYIGIWKKIQEKFTHQNTNMTFQNCVLRVSHSLEHAPRKTGYMTELPPTANACKTRT
jgi:hypothetical protein